MRLSTIILFFLSFSLYGQNWNYKYVDSLSFELYQQKQWRALNELSKDAYNKGIDYYLIRIRSDIAYMERLKYMRALTDLKKAIQFNSYDQLPMTLSIISYLNTGRHREARGLNVKDTSGLKFLKFGIESGPLISGKHSAETDLDGTDNVYGEHLRLLGAGYFGVFGSILINKTWKLNFQYSYMKTKGDHMIAYNDLVQSKLYSLKQDQYYFSPSAYLGNGFYMEPYLNYVKSKYPAYIATFDSLNYSYDPGTQTYNSINYYYSIDSLAGSVTDFTTGMSFEKRWSQFYLGLDLAMNRIDKKEGYQSGVSFTWYLTGSFDYYIYSALYAQYEADHFSIHHNHKMGIQFFKNSWIESSIGLGEFKGFSVNKGTLLYNMPDDIEWRGALCIKHLLRNRVEISLRYVYLKKNQEYIKYVSSGFDQNNFQTFEESLFQDNYNQHLFIFGLNINL